MLMMPMTLPPLMLFCRHYDISLNMIALRHLRAIISCRTPASHYISLPRVYCRLPILMLIRFRLFTLPPPMIRRHAADDAAYYVLRRYADYD